MNLINVWICPFSKFRLNSAQFLRAYEDLHFRYALPVGAATGFITTSMACGYDTEPFAISLPIIFGGTILGGVGMCMASSCLVIWIV